MKERNLRGSHSIHQLSRWSLVTLFGLLLSGCSATSAISVAGAMANAALESVGLKKPDLPESQKPPRDINIQAYAGSNLNANTAGVPLALVIKIYRLRSSNTFSRLPFNVFLDATQEKQALAEDLIGVREIIAVPGQKYDLHEKVERQVGSIGIVALFHSPAAQRWRYAFDPADVEKSGIRIGLHTCAITVTAGLSDAKLLSEASSLATAKCP